MTRNCLEYQRERDDFFGKSFTYLRVTLRLHYVIGEREKISFCKQKQKEQRRSVTRRLDYLFNID